MKSITRQRWPGKGILQRPGPWCRTKHALRMAQQSQPFELFLSIALILFGLRALTDENAAPNSISAQPEPITYFYCAFSVVAGVVTLVGLLLNSYELGQAACPPADPHLREGRWAQGIEQAGLYFSAAAWMSYFVGVIGSTVTANTTLLLLALMALAGANVSRALSLRRQQRERLEIIRSIQEQVQP